LDDQKVMLLAGLTPVKSSSSGLLDVSVDVVDGPPPHAASAAADSPPAARPRNLRRLISAGCDKDMVVSSWLIN
jgi:hypothetical protein